MQSKICVYEIQSFLLLKRVKCLIYDEKDKAELGFSYYVFQGRGWKTSRKGPKFYTLMGRGDEN